MGANCNQAIMIVTDGVPYKYEEIFKTYNFPHKNVRYGDRILDFSVKLRNCHYVVPLHALLRHGVEE